MDITADAAAPDDWIRFPGEVLGVPLWKWRDGDFYAATRDMDQLLFIGAALTLFDEMSALEFHTFVSSRPGARWETIRSLGGADRLPQG